MPYYTGVANSFADLRTVLFNACTDNGWTLTSDILTKGDLVVKVEVNTVSTSNKGIGLILTGATSLTGTTLNQPSPNTPRMGPPQTGLTQPTWPMEYYIHVNDNPDEMYFISRFNIDFLYFLSFGKSDIPGLLSTGLFLAATANCHAGPSGAGITCTLSGVRDSGRTTACMFWSINDQSSTASHTNANTLASGLDSVIWSNNPAGTTETSKYAASAISAARTFLSVQPNAWNSEAPLNRIQAYQWRDSGKCSLVMDLKHARYIRVDNYDLGQVIQLGLDKWKVYPFYRKNVTSRDGGASIQHTGTFGWAIRYDGP